MTQVAVGPLDAPRVFQAARTHRIEPGGRDEPLYSGGRLRVVGCEEQHCPPRRPVGARRERLRAERAAGRGHQALDERLARQLPQQEKAERATYVIANDGDIDELESQLSAVLDILEP